jgi:hypothetical protein
MDRNAQVVKYPDSTNHELDLLTRTKKPSISEIKGG